VLPAPSVVVCPRDGAELVEVERNGVMIDACPTCRGIWLGRGELEKLIAHDRAGAADDDFLDEVTGRHDAPEYEDEDDRSKQSGRKRTRKLPRELPRLRRRLENGPGARQPSRNPDCLLIN
jgi:Zn-finger nucleic acid-binding protein